MPFWVQLNWLAECILPRLCREWMQLSVTAVIFNKIEAIFTPNQIGPINMVWPMNISHTHLPPWNRASVTFEWATKIDRIKEWRKEQQFFTLFAQCNHDMAIKENMKLIWMFWLGSFQFSADLHAFKMNRNVCDADDKQFDYHIHKFTVWADEMQ